jgi:hypothetical protein
MRKILHMESFRWMMAIYPLIAHNNDAICPQKVLNEGICILHTSIALHLCPRVCLKSQITKKSYLYIVFASSVQSGFLPRKRATVDRNRSRTDPHIAGTEPDHLGPVYFSPWDRFKPVFFGKIQYTNINHLYLNYNYSEN